MGLINLLNTEISDTSNIKERFDEIAEMLFNNYLITRRDNIYEFLEIEFYYYKAEHEDITTYPRNIDGGMWYFHKSGVDITFKSKCENEKETPSSRQPGNDFFGGILIRSLLKADTKEVICGPLNCMYELFDQFNAFEATKGEFPTITKKEKTEYNEIHKRERYINIKQESIDRRYGKDNESFKEYHKAEYRYYIDLKEDWNTKNVKSYSAKPW